MTFPQMKIQIFITAIILAIAAVIGWQIDGRYAAARAEEGQLVGEAQQLGVAGNGDPSARTKKVERGDREAEAKQLAVEYATQAKEWHAATVMDEAAKQRYDAIQRRVSALDQSQLGIFTMDVLATMNHGEKRQAKHALSLLERLARKDPTGALAYFTKHSSVLRLVDDSEYFVAGALGSWAKEDPLSALKWIRKNAAEYPEALSLGSLAVVRGAAEKDPRMALSLIAGLELDFSNAHNAMNAIVIAAKTDEEMSVTLAAIREFREANRNNKELTRAADGNLAYFAQELSKQSFEAANKWIENAKLNPRELNSLAQGLGNNFLDEPDRWIEWIGRAFPPGKGDGHIMNVIGNWTGQDYEAAGKWLASASEGRVKYAAIRGYAQTIFQHDPETAIQWIMTLPPGKDRDETLKTIHMNWSKDDPVGGEAFKQEHGIK